MHIKSSKLAAKTPHPKPGDSNLAGVILAVPKQTDSDVGKSDVGNAGTGNADTGNDEKWKSVLAEGMYVFPAKPDQADPLASEIAALAKTISVQFASSLHPHLGTGVKAGWIVVGAVSLFNRAQSGNTPWHEIALDGGELALDALSAANSAMPEEHQWSAGWTEGTGLLLQATKDALHDGDPDEFALQKTLDQSIPDDLTKRLVSLALAAQHSSDKYSPLLTKPIEVEVRSA